MAEQLTIAEAKENGFIRGSNIASWVDIPEIGMKLPNHIDWVGIGEIENEQDQMYAMELMASESESNDRSFTPFEHTAHEINEHENADELLKHSMRELNEKRVFNQPLKNEWINIRINHES